MTETPDPGKSSIVEPTRFGFKWGPLEVEQLACEHRFDEPYETVEVIELRRVRAALEGKS